MVNRTVAIAFVIGLLGVCLTARADQREAARGYPWYEGNKRDGFKVCLYLFVHGDCDGCKNADVFVKDLMKRLPWVKVVTFDLYAPGSEALYQRMADNEKKPSDSCPAFFYCNQSRVGFVSYEETGKLIEQELRRWYGILRNR